MGAGRLKQSEAPDVAESLFNNQQSIGVGTEAGSSGAGAGCANAGCGWSGEFPKLECSHDASAVGGVAYASARAAGRALSILVKGMGGRVK